MPSDTGEAAHWLALAAEARAAAMPSGKYGFTRWLALASEARAIAAEATDPTTRATMLKIADGYDSLGRIVKNRQDSSV